MGDTAGAKELAGCWLGGEAMAAVLAGLEPAPKDIVSQDRLWRLEDRVGLARNADTHTASEGMLYATAHVRVMRKS